MSEKDTNSSSSKAENIEKLSNLLKNGLGFSKSNLTPYEKLQAIIDAKRLQSDVIGYQFRKSQCASKAAKESSLLRQHREVWTRECSRLRKAAVHFEDDIDCFMEQIKPFNLADSPIFSIFEYDTALKMEREETFTKATVKPVYLLRDDLCFRLNNMQDLKLNEDQSSWEEVLTQIKLVKYQQKLVVGQLGKEYSLVEKELEDLGLEKYFINLTDALLASENVPQEIFDAKCPYPDLKVLLIQAFQSMSEKYQGRMRSLQERLQKIDKYCDWSPEDHRLFLFTITLYTPDIPDHRELCKDMMSRMFPERTSLELLEHERLWDWQRFTQAQLRVVTQQFHRDLGDLRVRALVSLEEASHAHQEELENEKDRQRQKNIRSKLKKKLQRWRAQQEEMAKLEAAVAARQQKEEEARIKEEQQKETSIRQQKKEKVKHFHSKQQKRKAEVQQRELERLESLRSALEEQAKQDRERVQFRADILQQRRAVKEAEELERQREEQDRQNRLKALTKQVEIVADADPDRMMGETEAWRNRLLDDKEFLLERPLYPINTYTDTQIVSDTRIRVEQALREAGLHHTQYAKEVLSDIKPPKPPRRDTESMLQF